MLAIPFASAEINIAPSYQLRQIRVISISIVLSSSPRAISFDGNFDHGAATPPSATTGNTTYFCSRYRLFYLRTGKNSAVPEYLQSDRCFFPLRRCSSLWLHLRRDKLSYARAGAMFLFIRKTLSGS